MEELWFEVTKTRNGCINYLENEMVWIIEGRFLCALIADLPCNKTSNHNIREGQILVGISTPPTDRNAYKNVCKCTYS